MWWRTYLTNCQFLHFIINSWVQTMSVTCSITAVPNYNAQISGDDTRPDSCGAHKHMDSHNDFLAGAGIWLSVLDAQVCMPSPRLLPGEGMDVPGTPP